MAPVVKDLPMLLERAIGFHQGGNLTEAERGYRAILVDSPHHFDALHLLGVLQFQRGRLEEALRLIGAALAANTQSADAHAHLGSVLSALGRHEKALAHFDAALGYRPSSAIILSNRGLTLNELGRYDEALSSYDRALAIDPDLAATLCNRSVPLSKLFRHEEALASCDRALAIDPGLGRALSNRAVVLIGIHRNEEALASCDKAIAAAPDDALAHFNRGVALHALWRFEDALASYDRAIALAPRLPEARSFRGTTLGALGRHDEAVCDFERALELRPDADYAIGNLVLSKIRVCDWRTYADDLRRLLADTRAGRPCVVPFAMLALADSASDQLSCAKTWVRETCPAARTPIWQGEMYEHDRIRIAYLSADFHDHATAYLMAELFERHDRGRFETWAISFGPDRKSEMRSRLVAGFDHFIDVRAMGDPEVGRLLRKLEIDIAIDLKGYSDNAREGILAQRPAPIQVNYLGYPGTSGASYIDYLLADGFVIPPGAAGGYSEKVVYLPDCYQVNDSRRRIGERTPRRHEVGLPDEGFVFCCFNNSYKITPAIFDIWMRLLQRIDGSVLWLLRGNASAENNLRNEARARGVDPARLVFAARVPFDEHLARHRLADLFVDTLPCNAHTTASDALWAGLPVLTCAGGTFAGRVAGSLLRAIGLPELVTGTLGHYETLALELATRRDFLAGVRQKLARNRETFPLFDTGRACHHIEAAYVGMWERHRRGVPPESFAVVPMPNLEIPL
jgi:predicted O-linked N-acetylglucosamine transferase (SPINDLY family)